MRYEIRLASLKAPPNPWGIQLAADLQKVEALRKKLASEIGRRFADKLVDADPSQGKKFVQWMATRARKKVINERDLTQIKEDLTVFDLLLRTKKLKGPDRDLNRLKTPKALFDLVEPYREAESNRKKEEEEKKRMYASADVVYDGPKGLILVPKTYEASCFFGRYTQWCTTSKEHKEYFDDYAGRGTLYIIVPAKKLYKGEKYQLFKPNKVGKKNTWELNDEKDKRVNYDLLRNRHNALIKVLEQNKIPPTRDDEMKFLISLLSKSIDKDLHPDMILRHWPDLNWQTIMRGLTSKGMKDRKFYDLIDFLENEELQDEEGTWSKRWDKEEVVAMVVTMETARKFPVTLLPVLLDSEVDTYHYKGVLREVFRSILDNRKNDDVAEGAASVLMDDEMYKEIDVRQSEISAAIGSAGGKHRKVLEEIDWEYLTPDEDDEDAPLDEDGYPEPPVANTTWTDFDSEKKLLIVLAAIMSGSYEYLSNVWGFGQAGYW